MLSSSAKGALFDMRDNILLAQEFVADLDAKAFSNSRLRFYAATRALEIISEASRRLPDELRARHPELPWREIRDAGNIYRHNYDNVAESLVWDTVRLHLPDLMRVVLVEIERLGDG